MILDELVLHNVGVFSGHHTLKLTPPSPKRPVVLIGGLNGSGKTTIRDAIYLVMYGPLALGSTRRGGNYDRYLTSLISRDQPKQQGATIELAFRAHREGAEHTYRVCRSWQVTSSGVNEQLAVLLDGRSDKTLAATWTEHVESFLPRGIAGLFFFDGEQVEAMADLEQSKEVMRAALDALLGLDLVDRLDTDLAVLRRRHRVQGLPEDLRARLADAQAAVTVLRQSVESAGLAEAAARVGAERASKHSSAAADAYRVAGGDLIEQRDQLSRQVLESREDLAQVDSSLKDVAAGAAPFLFVVDQLLELSRRAAVEAEATRDRLLLDALEERDDRVISQLRESKVRAAAIKSVEVLLLDDRRQREESANTPVVVDIRDPQEARYLVEHVVPGVRTELHQLLARRSDIVGALDSSERLIAAIPDPETLLPLLEEKDNALGDLFRAQAALAQAEEHRIALSRDRDRAEDSYESVLDEATEAGLLADDDRRLVEHIERVRQTLTVLRAAATQRHVDRIGELVLQSLNKLLRKENLITDVQIDPVTLAVELCGRDGRPLASDALSAGERQLLAVALLWGLAQAAGQPLPVVIDTPLGRLDSAHRERLLERYFPAVSHQVILLSTDTEIDREARQKLRPFVGRTYCLRFNQATASTDVESGYFWKD